MGATNVPGLSFTDQGFVAPDEPDVQAGVAADMQAAFGGSLNPGAKTPQGQLIVSTTAIIGDANDQKCALFNGVDPARASGRMQDAIGRIYFMDRLAATSTTVPCVCVGGSPGVTVDIPAGSLVKDGSGNLYASTQDAQIVNGVSVTVNFACIVTGPIACPAGALTNIYKAIPGWDSVSNPTGTDTDPTLLGRNVESRVDFEARRQATVAENSVNMVTSVRAKIVNVAGVISAWVWSNDTGGPVTVGGVTIPAGDLYVAVQGGSSSDIANAIWLKKPPGIPMYNSGTGATTVNITDPNPAYNPAPPPYPISYINTGENETGILFTVNLTNSSSVPANAQALIAGAIANAMVGGDGGPAGAIGNDVYASRFIAPVVALGSWAQQALINIKIGSVANGEKANVQGTISGNTLTVTAVNSGSSTLAIGDFITGASMNQASVITALGTGTGGAGTYTLRDSFTVSTSSAFDVVTPAQDKMSTNVNQFPVASADRVNVVLH